MCICTFSERRSKIYLHCSSTHIQIPKADIFTMLLYLASIMTVHWQLAGCEYFATYYQGKPSKINQLTLSS